MNKQLFSILTAILIVSMVASCKKNEIPVIAINTNPAAITAVTEGSITDSISVAASVSEGATLSYQWYSNTSAKNSGGTAIEEATSATYTIPDTLTVGSYYYYCEISATGGTISVRSNVATVMVTDGSPTYPFIVNSEATLLKAGTGADGWTPGKHYKQTANITLDATEWTPIGTEENRFTGSYDGEGYSISNLNIFSATADFQGMFGYIGTGGAVRNVALKNADINVSTDYAGGMAGYNSGIIENCYVTGTITGGGFVGGMAGYNDGEIKNCYTVCNVAGSGSYTGGITGLNYTGRKIANCYATGIITGIDRVGGIVGQNYGTVDRCVALNKEISATDDTGRVGRVVSYNEGSGLTNNFARAEGMTLNVNDIAIDPEETTSTGKDGENIAAEYTHGNNSLEWWSTGRDTNLWSFANNSLPWLKTAITGDDFSETQSPAVQ